MILLQNLGGFTLTISSTELADQVSKLVRLHGFKLEPQDDDFWCWAAVAISIAGFLKKKRKFNSQCELVGEALQGKCKQNCRAAGCDTVYPVESAVRLYEGIRLSEEEPQGLVDFDIIVTSLRDGEPVGCRVVEDAKSTHAVVVSKASKQKRTVFVLDPRREEPDRFWQGTWDYECLSELCHSSFVAEVSLEQ